MILTAVSMAVGQEMSVVQKQIIIVLGEQRLYAVSQETRESSRPMHGLIITSIDGLSDGIDYSFHCSTGRDGLATPLGNTKVAAKIRHGRALKVFGGGKLEFVLQIHMYDPRMKRHRRIDIHAYNRVPKRPASHGCIRLKNADAEQLFGWVTLGTPVLIVQNAPVWLAKLKAH